MYVSRSGRVAIQQGGTIVEEAFKELAMAVCIRIMRDMKPRTCNGAFVPRGGGNAALQAPKGPLTTGCLAWQFTLLSQQEFVQPALDRAGRPPLANALGLPGWELLACMHASK